MPTLLSDGSAAFEKRAFLPCRPARRAGSALGAALLAASLLLGACDARLTAPPPPAPEAPLPPLPGEERLLAGVWLEFDPATGVLRQTVVPLGVPFVSGARADAQVVNQYLAASNVACSACDDGVTGQHTISLTLTSNQLLANVAVDNVRCLENCSVTSTTTNPSTLPEVLEPAQHFDVEVKVNVPEAKPFRVAFDVMGNVVQVTLCLQEVSFEDDHEIDLDGAGKIADPVWTDADCDRTFEESEPVAYMRNTKIKLTAKLKVTVVPEVGQNLDADILASSTYPLKFTFPAKALPGNGGTVTVTVEADAALKDEPGVTTLGLAWSFTLKARPDRSQGIGSSSHLVYATLGAPTTTVYLTLLDHTTRNASGRTDEAEVVEAIWGEFTDRDVRKRSLDPAKGTVTTVGDPLGYYKNPACNVQETVDLLRTGDGQCGAWARYFRDALATHGIGSEIMEVRPKEGDLMLVKNWNFIGQGTGCAEGFPFPNAEVQATDGVAGQGNGNPKSHFINHALVRHGGKLYDPSYGTGPFDTLLEWEVQSVDGYALEDGNGDPECARPDRLMFEETEMEVFPG